MSYIDYKIAEEIIRERRKEAEEKRRNRIFKLTK